LLQDLDYMSFFNTDIIYSGTLGTKKDIVYNYIQYWFNTIYSSFFKYPI